MHTTTLVIINFKYVCSLCSAMLAGPGPPMLNGYYFLHNLLCAGPPMLMHDVLIPKIFFGFASPSQDLGSTLEGLGLRSSSRMFRFFNFGGAAVGNQNTSEQEVVQVNIDQGGSLFVCILYDWTFPHSADRAISLFFVGGHLPSSAFPVG